MEAVGLEESLLDRPATDLSGGQEQRLSIARALANRPNILLLDEPTSSLDPMTTAQVEKSLLRARNERGLTLIWVSHSIEQARRIAVRVLLLENGAIVRLDTVSAMLDEENGDQRALAFAHGQSKEG
jgi:putative ABC transport system ATP-binding protein